MMFMGVVERNPKRSYMCYPIAHRLRKHGWPVGFPALLMKLLRLLSRRGSLWLASKVSRFELRNLVAIVWVAWHCRKNKVHENLYLKYTIVAEGFTHVVEEHGSYVKKCSAFLNILIVSRHQFGIAPPIGMTKFNVNSHVTNSYVGIGVVARDELGNVLLTATKRLEVGLSVEIAEAVAARYNVQITRRFGYDRVWMKEMLLMYRRQLILIRRVSPLYILSMMI